MLILPCQSLVLAAYSIGRLVLYQSPHHMPEGSYLPASQPLPPPTIKTNENAQNSPPPSQCPCPSRFVPFFFLFPLHFASLNCIFILIFESWNDYRRLLTTHTLPSIHADNKTKTKTTITTTTISMTTRMTSPANELVEPTTSMSRSASLSV